MERATNPSSGPKVSQIANIFQRKPSEMEELPADQIKDQQHQQQPQPPIPGGRAESHSTRFNNARALFEKLGVENRVPRPAALSLKMTNSSSKEDNLGESSPDHDRIRTPSPKHNKYPSGNNIGNGVPKRDPTKIHNAFRNKAEKPEKPEKPERKFNSKELIEKQKNWTSHFTKARTTRFNSDPNRCDIIRTVPGTGLYSSNDHSSVETCRTSTAPPANTTTTNNITTGHTYNSNPAVAQINNNYNNNNNSSATTVHSNYTVGSNSNHINTTTTASAILASSKSIDIPARPNSPPNPPVRQHSIPPEVKPRNNRPTPSPCKSPPPPIPLNKPQICSPVKSGVYVGYDPVAAKTSPVKNSKQDDEIPEKRKRSLDLIDDECDQLMDSTSSSTTNSSTTAAPTTAEYAQVKKYSIDSALGSVSPGHAISSSPSPAPSASSGPSSPIHTEDEKQENESTEKAELLKEEFEPAQREYSSRILISFSYIYFYIFWYSIMKSIIVPVPYNNNLQFYYRYN